MTKTKQTFTGVLCWTLGCTVPSAGSDSVGSATGSSDAASETSGGASTGDGRLEDGSAGDGSTGDGSTGDGSAGDGSAGDGSAGNGSAGDSGATTGGETDAGEASGGANGPPVFLALDVAPLLLLGAGSIHVVAVVTDPDGISDVIGGTVASPSGAVYGALLSSADEGAYEIELTWNDLNAVSEINIDPDDIEARELEVTVFDQSGASVSGLVTVDLRSAAAGYAVCAGASVSLAWDTHCSECGFSCLDDLGSSFTGGACLDADVCEKQGLVYVYDFDTTCDEACAVAAGPNAIDAGADDCYVVAAGTDCPDPIPNALGTCPGLSLSSLPNMGCSADSETFLACSCYAAWQPF